jgi:hypothetical protein
MSSIPRNTAIRQELQYIAVAEMRNEVFEYSTSVVGFKTIGTFTAPYVSGGAKEVSIPAGTILVETGRKLFRGANPNVPTFLVQVSAYTPGTDKAADGTDIKGNGQTLMYGATGKAVVGFIDPSSPNIALYSVSRSPANEDGLYYANVTDLNAGGAATTKAEIAAAAGVAHRGPSLFTGGSLTAASVNTSGAVTAASVTMTGGVLTQRVGTAITAASGEIAINAGSASIFQHTTTLSGAVIYAVTGPVGSVFYILITNGGGQAVKFKSAGAGSATVFTTITATGPGSVVMVQNTNATAITTGNGGLITGVITAAAT